MATLRGWQSGDPFRFGNVVRLPGGGFGKVLGMDVLGGVVVQFEHVGGIYPWSPDELRLEPLDRSLMRPDHDPTGRGCALAGRARGGEKVAESDICRICYES